MPKKIEVSLDEMLASRKDISDDNGVIYKAHVAPRSWNDEERSAIFVMSAETTDSYGDIVVQSGIDTVSRFDANPVALFGHRSWDMPVGQWSDLKMVRSSPKRTEGKVTFSAEGVDDVADRVARNVKAGTLRAASIGFMPKSFERILDEKGEWTYGYKFMEIELYECSIVTIPAVREALMKGAGGKAEDIVSPEVIEEFLDHLKANPGLAKMINRDLYEGVYREITGNKITSLGSFALDLDTKSLDRLETIAERMEKAADRVAAGGTLSEADLVDETEVDELFRDMEVSVEKALAGFQPKVDAVEEPERKGALTKMLDGIRGIFKASPEPEKKDPVVEPEKADPEVQAALKKQLEEIAARYPEAA